MLDYVGLYCMAVSYNWMNAEEENVPVNIVLEEKISPTDACFNIFNFNSVGVFERIFDKFFQKWTS